MKEWGEGEGQINPTLQKKLPSKSPALLEENKP